MKIRVLALCLLISTVVFCGCTANSKKDNGENRLYSFIGVTLGMNLVETENVLGQGEQSNKENVYIFDNGISVAYNEKGTVIAIITNNPEYKVLDIAIGDRYAEVLKKLGLPNRRIAYDAAIPLIFCNWNKYNVAISFYKEIARTVGVFDSKEVNHLKE